jgi:hypothetical protein
VPDEPTPTPDEAAADGGDASSGAVQPGMSETQIRDAGLAIDVPFESGEPAPQRFKYADLGKPWTPPEGWPPEEGATSAADEEGDT